MATEDRLIYANALKAKFPVTGQFEKDLWHSATIRAAIANAPTVAAVEVVHGHWTSTTEPVEQFGEMDYFKCSVCGKLQWFDTNYCPNCGAKMDGDGNG